MLYSGVQDASANTTRFLVLSREPTVCSPDDPRPHKTSLAFALPEGPKRLYEALSVFALRNLDICKVRGGRIAAQEQHLVPGIRSAVGLHFMFEFVRTLLALGDIISEISLAVGSFVQKNPITVTCSNRMVISRSALQP